MEEIRAADAYQISSNSLVLPEAVVRLFENGQPVVTYLANTIGTGEGESQRKIPYSTVTGVDSTAALARYWMTTAHPSCLPMMRSCSTAGRPTT